MSAPQTRLRDQSPVPATAPTKKRIAVIGAGASGLVAAYHLVAQGFHVTIFEHKAEAGGLWNTAAGGLTGTNPVYEGLETNVPRQLMTFSNMAWPSDAPVFSRSTEVCGYLQHYAHKLKNSEYAANVDFSYVSEVVRLYQVTRNKTKFWEIEYLKYPFGGASGPFQSLFHCVVVAIGNYHGMYQAALSGGELFPETMLHSSQYRTAREFAGKNVLIIGNSASGWDISAQISAVACKVLVSTSRSNVTHQGTIAVPPIQRYESSTRSIEFADGRVVTDVDKIVYCTGYEYDFAFIRKSSQSLEPLFGTGLMVRNVYEHIFYTQEPTLAFVGLPKMSAAFTVAEAQSAVIARAFDAKIGLPSRPRYEEWERKHTERWVYQMQTGLSTANGYHSFQFARDKQYVNDLLHWSLDAPYQDDRYQPVYWCACLDKFRAQSGSIRAKFKAQGDARHQFNSLASLGFTDFPGWLKEGEQRLSRLAVELAAAMCLTEGQF